MVGFCSVVFMFQYQGCKVWIASLACYFKVHHVFAALRDLFESMEKTSSSIPPIILLQFLHMAFPQFAEKGDQGQYLQQVIIRLVCVVFLKSSVGILYSHKAFLFVANANTASTFILSAA